MKNNCFLSLVIVLIVLMATKNSFAQNDPYIIPGLMVTRSEIKEIKCYETDSVSTSLKSRYVLNHRKKTLAKMRYMCNDSVHSFDSSVVSIRAYKAGLVIPPFKAVRKDSAGRVVVIGTAVRGDTLWDNFEYNDTGTLRHSYTVYKGRVTGDSYYEYNDRGLIDKVTQKIYDRNGAVYTKVRRYVYIFEEKQKGLRSRGNRITDASHAIMMNPRGPGGRILICGSAAVPSHAVCLRDHNQLMPLVYSICTHVLSLSKDLHIG
jgi:hypothetical protein